MANAKLCITLAAALMTQSVMSAEKNISTHVASGTLGGTLLTTDSDHGHSPLVLIIPGSGPTDRDGNNRLGVTGAPYRMLAAALAQHGISSLRIDKRGLFGSANQGLDPNDATIDAYADDIHAWVKEIRATTAHTCVWVLGHSEGGLVAGVAARKPDGICGLILVSAAGQNGADVIKRQLQSNPANAPLLPRAFSAIESLRAGHRVDVSSFPAPLQSLFNPAVQNYLINWFSFDPAQELKGFAGPIIVIQGTDDLQINLDDATRLASARPGIALKTIHGMNHVLKLPAAGVAANLASYADPSMPLAPELAPAIADFILKHGDK
ncbi:alpha/beta hydrolase [Dyella tabacisoli]|uniref:Alpha/beta fold hydrolase n=1 Tax=Dyella tabacisoli TaxID=2282381 RepID=A0A369UK91_9GAMM|nr:alpha/beta fold hydrolase [Dyella tabacisoli]RDD80010.1 alpha/beta fold hydrolase [Dyella tabacisoli]